MSSKPPTLDDLRKEIDQIDTALHDLLMRRTEVVEAVRRVKNDSGGPVLRPGREAQVLRRLVARHKGAFPKPVLVRLWREIMSAYVRLQGPFSLAVFMPTRGAGYLELARDQYGSYTPAETFRSAGRVVAAVAEGKASVGVLPWPTSEGDAWWNHLSWGSEGGVRVVARLPFCGASAGRDGVLEALAVARVDPEETGEDASLLVAEAPVEQSWAKLEQDFFQAGFSAPRRVQGIETARGGLHLVEVDGFITPKDRRLAAMPSHAKAVERVRCVGAYATPLATTETV